MLKLYEHVRIENWIDIDEMLYQNVSAIIISCYLHNGIFTDNFEWDNSKSVISIF